MPDAPTLSRTGVRGLGFQVRNTGEYRLYTTAQWSEDGVQHHKLRSISIRGVPRAAHSIARVLVENHPCHEDKDPKQMAETCREALDRTILRIHENDEYPNDNGRRDIDQRLRAVHDFVEHSPRLP